MEIDKYVKEKIFTQLDNNVKLQKLIKSIYYTEGHNVDIMTMNSAIHLNLLLEYIDMILKYKLEEKKIITIVLEENTQNIFDKVQQYYHKEGEYLFVFDGTRLDDSSDYEYIFMMINKERNQLLEKLNAPILLVIPKNLQQSFSHTASDFWSVKKYSVDIRLELDEDAEELSIQKENFWIKIKQKISKFFSLFTKENENLQDSDELLELLSQVDILKKQAKDKSNFSKNRLYLISLSELGDYYEKNGSLKEAFKIYEKAVLLAQSIEKKRPDSIEAKRDLSVSYYKIAMLYKNEKEFVTAQEKLLKARALILPFKDYKYGDFDNMLRIFEEEIEELKGKH